MKPSSAAAFSDGLKSFGLHVPKSKQPLTAAKPRAFAMDDDDDTASSTAPASLQLANIRAKRYAEEQARVLSEDATVYSYDEIYDAEQAKKKPIVSHTAMRLGYGSSTTAAAASTSAAAPAAPSRYIASLLTKSAARKIEADAIHERQLLKERESEDAQFAGKEKFVTSAYKEHLAEQERIRKAQEEQDRLDEAAEAARMKGGAAGLQGARFAMKQMFEKPSESKSQPPATASTTSKSSAHAALPTASPSSSSSKHDRDAASTSSAQTDEPSAKRLKFSFEDDMTDVEPNPTTAPTTTMSTTSSSRSLAPEAIQRAALLKVFYQLTVDRISDEKVQEARARYLARKAAAGTK